MEKLIAKHTCNMCDKRINKKEIYTVHVDTLDGPLTLTICQACATDFDQALKEIEDIQNDVT